MTVWRHITLTERSGAGAFVRRTMFLFPTTGAEVQGTLIAAGTIDNQNVNAQRGRSAQLHSTSRIAGAITRMASIDIDGNDYSAIQALGKNVYVIPCWGQSNEVGHGDLTQYPVPFPDASVAARIFMSCFSDDLLPAAEPININTNTLYTQYADTGVDGSPLLQIAETLALADANHVYIIVPSVFGGTTSTDWVVDDAITSLYGGGVFRTLQVCRQLKALLQPDGFTVTIPFFFGGQGESNGQSVPLCAAWPVDWNANWNQMETDWAEFMPSDGLHVVYAQVSPTLMPGLASPPYTQALWDTLRAAQATLQSSKRVMITKPNGPLIADNIHLNWGKSTLQGLYKVGHDAALAALAAWPSLFM